MILVLKMTRFVFLAFLTFFTVIFAGEIKTEAYYEIELNDNPESSSEIKVPSNPNIVNDVAFWIENDAKREVIEKFDDPDFRLIVANLDDETLSKIKDPKWKFSAYLSNVQKDDWMNNLSWSEEEEVKNDL